MDTDVTLEEVKEACQKVHQVRSHLAATLPPSKNKMYGTHTSQWKRVLDIIGSQSFPLFRGVRDCVARSMHFYLINAPKPTHSFPHNSPERRLEYLYLVMCDHLEYTADWAWRSYNEATPGPYRNYMAASLRFTIELTKHDATTWCDVREIKRLKKQLDIADKTLMCFLASIGIDPRECEETFVTTSREIAREYWITCRGINGICEVDDEYPDSDPPE